MSLTLIEHKLHIFSQSIGVSVYDFNFELHFNCEHPYILDEEERCVLRIGAINDYAAEYADKLAIGLRLINSPQEHELASELENWYPIIKEFTPRTLVFDSLPTVEEIESEFQWPVFLKGSRQTSKHSADLSIIQSPQHYQRTVSQYKSNAILHWQKPVIREFIPLMPITNQATGKIPASIEYRSFWWHGDCVGCGRYWYQYPPYDCEDMKIGLEIAKIAAQRLNIPFLVIDFAKTQNGDWIIIECNDAQESGYADIPPQVLWRNVLALIL